MNVCVKFNIVNYDFMSGTHEPVQWSPLHFRRNKQ